MVFFVGHERNKVSSLNLAMIDVRSLVDASLVSSHAIRTAA